ncbi:hypothetical protein COO91_06951 [Nostoc flagelliforme CCNUN1]|uniref:Uncharacterized protein n=1 Tax=Nostoc flagelliforme CCNUN1 TaxID=2038116 RepID=A0A2K8T1P3_9NOSO|nr:hypothetical protein COO91_06951 [Nostoc flagelliforme CCNUN1]
MGMAKNIGLRSLLLHCLQLYLYNKNIYFRYLSGTLPY